jgi:hypothetical protein
MAIRDNQLDDAITLVLETQTVVTARQKAAAWEQLRVQAAHQVILAPYAVPPRPPLPRRTRAYQLTVNLMRIVVNVLVDDRVYHRAAANRHFIGMTHIIGSEIMIHYLPLRPMYRYAC